MRMHRLVSLLILSLTPIIGLSQVYSWKDANGKIHYGDRPPAERQTDSRKLAPPPPADESARKAAAESQVSDREKQQKTQESAKKTQEDQAEAKKREEGCLQAKSNLAAIESGQIRFSIDAKGERVAMDGAVRDAELNRARQNVDSWCKPPAKPAAK
jgi:type IV secretory pathway VirB10-like protein